MIHPLTYGTQLEYGNGSMHGYFDWKVANKQSQVFEMLTSSNDMAYGIGNTNQREIEPKFSEIQFTSGVSNPYGGGVNHPNGKIYIIPRDETQIIEFDPRTNIIKKFGSLTSETSKFIGGVLAPNGMIYCFPTDTYASILRINPYNLKIELIPKYSVNDDCGGAVLANNGMIYTVPYSSANGVCFEFNPATEKYSSFGDTIGNYYYGACMGVNGKIYGAPWANTDQILVVDPYTKKTKFMSTPSSGSSNSHYQGIVSAPNGRLYVIPYSASHVLEVDPLNNKAKKIGTAVPGSYSGAAYAPDGFIYAVPTEMSNTNILRIDWKTGTTSLVPYPGMFTVSNNKYSGMLLSNNGCVYGFGGRSRRILKMDFGITIKDDVVFCREINKF